MQSTRYDIPFDDMSFSIFDTIGLEEPQMGINGYLKAIERAYELIVKLGAAGGIHLLLFCMRGGRITATTQSNYRLFCECLCNTKVPIALVFTGLEREVKMEDWWTRNKTHIEHYGIKSDDHACITAVQDEAPGEDLKYMESQERIRELLKTCALKNEAFLPEPHTWFAKLGKGMRSFIEKHRNPKRRDVMRVLTHRCKLDPETARKIADMMEKGDTETKDENKDEQVGNKEGEGGSNPVAGKDENELVKNAAKSDAPPKQYGDVKTEPRNDTPGGPDGGRTKMNVARDNSLPMQHVGVKDEPRNDAQEVLDGGRAMMNVTRDNAQALQHPGVKAEPGNDALELLDGGRPKMNVARDDSLAIPHVAVKAEPHNDALEVLDGGRPKMNVARDDSLAIPHVAVKAEPHNDVLEVLDGERPKMNVARYNSLAIPHAAVKAEPHNDALGGLDGRRPKMGGSDGDQSLNAGAVGQAKSKRDDTKRKPGVPSKVPLQSSGSWQVPSRGSHS
jgi:hypothetical protein